MQTARLMMLLGLMSFNVCFAANDGVQEENAEGNAKKRWYCSKYAIATYAVLAAGGLGGGIYAAVKDDGNSNNVSGDDSSGDDNGCTRLTDWNKKFKEITDKNVDTSTPPIIGGDEVDEVGKYPFQVAITSFENGYTSGLFDEQYCGGTLVAPNVVLTAAHCVDHGGDVQAVVGIHDLSDITDAQMIQVSEILIHPEYKDLQNGEPSYDFALIKLSENADEKHLPINLANAQTDFENSPLTVIGWGYTENGFPEILNEVDVSYVDQSACESLYNPFIIDQTMLCAADEGRDSCSGDSGGPIFVQSQDGPIQVGIVSWGYGCALPNYPGVYSRVSNQINWLENNICDFSPSSCEDSCD